MESELSISRITTIEEWDELVREADGSPIWLLKHSPICALSRDGRREFEQFVSVTGGDARWAMIEVQGSREVSNEVALRTGVRHETPQVILLAGDSVLWHGSHWDVSVSRLSRAAREAAAASSVAGGE